MKRGTLLIAHLTVIILLGSPSGVLGVQARLTDDAHTSSAQPNTNLGVNVTLFVSGTQDTYLKFDLSTLPAGTRRGGVVKATLSLYP